jgi:negative regulator of flagellin synthesis FlgM
MEDTTMSYSSGIGSPQQPVNAITPPETKPAIPAGPSSGVIDERPLASVEHADQTNLSSAARALDGPDIRSAKVAALQQAIAAGSYSVSSSDVADKIIQSLLG